MREWLLVIGLLLLVFSAPALLSFAVVDMTLCERYLRVRVPFIMANDPGPVYMAMECVDLYEDFTSWSTGRSNTAGANPAQDL